MREYRGLFYEYWGDSVELSPATVLSRLRQEGSSGASPRERQVDLELFVCRLLKRTCQFRTRLELADYLARYGAFLRPDEQLAAF